MTARLKEMVGHIPGAARVYAELRPGRPRTRYNLEQLAERLPAAAAQVRLLSASKSSGRRLILFATLHYWIEQAAMVALVLRGLGHKVTIAYLPYSDWRKTVSLLDVQRQDIYTRQVLSPLADLVDTVSLHERWRAAGTSDELRALAEQASAFDVMYSLQAENVDRDSRLYRLRMERNLRAGEAAAELLGAEKPDVVLIPNGLVTELGMFFRAAQLLQVPTVTYEFNDQREQIWVAQNDIVMQQNTDAIWAARGSVPLEERELAKVREFEAARRGATTYGKGTRLWQDVPSSGIAELRTQLGLDGRPIAVLATNVLGDSLTLGRHIFAQSMAEWIERTVQYLATHTEIQTVIRVHPGERLIRGQTMAGVIDKALPKVPPHMRVIGPKDRINTYDLMDMADLGLVYTTTVGMEMAMQGAPVIVAGRTHYRDRGFTIDPSSWEAYFDALGRIIANPRGHRLSQQQIDTAWNYAYRFFFEYPLDFPWRLMHFWKDLDRWPVSRVLSAEGQLAFGRTFECLAGRQIKW